MIGRGQPGSFSDFGASSENVRSSGERFGWASDLSKGHALALLHLPQDEVGGRRHAVLDIRLVRHPPWTI